MLGWPPTPMPAVAAGAAGLRAAPGSTPTQQLAAARDAVIGSGVGLLPGCLKPARVAELLAAATVDLAALQASHARRVAEDAAAPCDYAELLERGGGRLDMRHRLHARPWSAPDLAYNRGWFDTGLRTQGGCPVPWPRDCIRFLPTSH